jgi:Rrf2 family cysteine metabolism transcriptional repressor
MRFSAKAHYACVAMVELAYNYGTRTPVQVKAIGEAHGISQRFLTQILVQLRQNGLVDSTRGNTGGYLLARPPSRISLADVVSVIDQPSQPPPALSGANSTSAVMAVSRCLKEVQSSAQRQLREITLADIVKKTQPVSELSFQI